MSRMIGQYSSCEEERRVDKNFCGLRDLNRACPKVVFPLPNVDFLVDAVAGHEHFSFIDGYSGYN